MKKTAFIFPGQGSQSLGMLNDISLKHDQIKKTYAQASDALGYDLWTLVQEGPQERLDQTEFTQPALLAASVALWRLFKPQHVAVMAGHSLGEYSALVCANSLDFSDAIKLVALRGRLMQKAVPAGEGAMAALVGLEDGIVRTVCDEASQGEVLVPANYNAIGQVVIAGTRSAVERGVTLAKEKGAKLAKILPVSVPSHSPLMHGAAEMLEEALEKIDIKPPQIPVIHNVDVATHTDPQAIRAALVSQLYAPVRWVETVQRMVAEGINPVIECGPGKVLAGLCKRIDKSLEIIDIKDEL